MRPPSYSVDHQREAAKLHSLIVRIFGLLAFCCIVGGIIAIILNSKSETDFQIFGARFTTGDVGVALVGIGLLMTYFTVRAVLKSQKEIAALPVEHKSKQNTQVPFIQPLSKPEQQILISCAQSGELWVLKVDAFGSWVRSGKKDFFDQDDSSVQAQYLEAFETLKARGFIRHESDLLYRLTGSGFEIARKIEKSEPVPMAGPNNDPSPPTQYSEGDKKAILASWMGSRPAKLNSQVIHFTEVDRELKLENGTTKKYIKEIAARWHYVVQHEGEHTILFRQLPY